MNERKTETRVEKWRRLAAEGHRVSDLSVLTSVKTALSTLRSARNGWSCSLCGCARNERHDNEKLCGAIEAALSLSETLTDPRRILR